METNVQPKNLLAIGKRSWIRLLVIALCLFLYGCTNRISAYKVPDWWGQRKEAEGIIFKRNCVHGTGESIYYAYSINDTIYEDSDAWGYCTKTPVMAKYFMAYDSLNPEDHLILWHKPIFENHQQLRYNLDSIPQKMLRKNFRVTGTIIFEKNERLIKTLGVISWPELIVLSEDTLIDVECKIKTSKHSFTGLKYSELNDKGLQPDSIRGKVFMVEYDPRNVYRIKVLFDKPLVETRKYRLEFIDVDDKTEKNLNEAALNVGEGGVVYWSAKTKLTPNVYLTLKMKEFLETYQPRDKKGELLDVEIKIVDYENLEELF